MDFGSQVEASDFYSPRHFFKLRPGGGQEAPKRLPRASQERPRATKTCPGAKVPPQGTFSRISLFFRVFLHFSGFSCIFLCFFAFFCIFWADFCIFPCFLRFFRDFVAQNVFLADSEQKFALPGENSGFHNRCFSLTSSC